MTATLSAGKYIFHYGAIYRLLWLIAKKGETEIWRTEKQFSALEKRRLVLTPRNWTDCRLHGLATNG